MIAALVGLGLVIQGASQDRLQARAQDRTIPVQRGVSIEPDTVTVGDPFRVIVRIHAPRGAQAEFPPAPDSGAAVEALDPRQVRPNADTAAYDVSASYRLVAWDIGEQPLRLGDVVVQLDGRERRIPFGELQVFVRSVLPEDSTQRVPKPPRAIFEFGWPWWIWLLLALAAIAIISLLIWWWRRRRRGKAEPVLDPFAVAEQEFERVEAMGLIEAGERGRYVALVVEVLREYLARRIDEAQASLTTSELLAALRANALVPTSRLAAVLAEADLVKFARRSVTAERAREIGREARAIVRAVHEASLAAERAAKAAVPEEKAA